MFKSIVEFGKNVLAVLFALLFQVPNRRFDRMNGLNNDEYENLSGHKGLALEEITQHKGTVRYSGSNWKARLAPESPKVSILKGETVRILSATGNTVLVSTIEK